MLFNFCFGSFPKHTEFIPADSINFTDSFKSKVEAFGPEGAYLNVSGGPEGNHIYWYKDGKWSENTPVTYNREWQQGSDNFAYCLRMGTKPVVGFENGRNARYVLDKMYESAKNGEGWIEI